MNYKNVIVMDLETDGTDPETANPVEIAAVAINPRTLEIRTDDTFKVTVRPPGFTGKDYMTEEKEKTIAWHAKTRGVESQDIIDLWKDGLSEKIAWKQFVSFVNKWDVEKDPSKKLWYGQPIISGYNIDGFDIPILERLNKKHKTTWPFSKMPKSLDLLPLIYSWFWELENIYELPDFKLDTVKSYLGLESSGQAHEALSDVIDTAKIYVRFINFMKRQASDDKFNNCFG